LFIEGEEKARNGANKTTLTSKRRQLPNSADFQTALTSKQR
jgi:hypothetical protein